MSDEKVICKPCSYCKDEGGLNLHQELIGLDWQFSIKCKCGVRGPLMPTIKEAGLLWNCLSMSEKGE